MWMNTHFTHSLLCAQWQAAQWDMKYCPTASSICFFYFSLFHPSIASYYGLISPPPPSFHSLPMPLLPFSSAPWTQVSMETLSQSPLQRTVSIALQSNRELQAVKKLLNTKLWALFPWQHKIAFTCYYAASHLLGPFSHLMCDHHPTPTSLETDIDVEVKYYF